MEPPRWPHRQPLEYGNVHDVVAPLIASFDFAMSEGLVEIEAGLAQEVHVPSGSSGKLELKFWLSDLQLGEPALKAKSVQGNDFAALLLPRECRERRLDYQAPLRASLWRTLGNGAASRTDIVLGNVPVMVRSSKCNLRTMSPSELVAAGEESSEMGGYFIANGNEKFIRLLIMPRRNYPAAVERPAFCKKGAGFSSKAIVLRSVRADETSATLSLHYLNSGTCMAKIKILKSEYFIPLGLLFKCIRDKPFATDYEIFSRVTRGASHNSFASERIESELRACGQTGKHTYDQCIRYLGEQFRNKLTDLPPGASDEGAGVSVMERFVLPHLPSAGDAKFDCLVEMTRKLYAFVQGVVGPDDPDALCSQEILMPGHIYLQILRENLEYALWQTRNGYEVELAKDRGENAGVIAQRLGEALAKDNECKDLKARVLKYLGDVGRKLFYFLATGNLVSRSGLDCQQTGGFCVLAEKLNRLRYLSHFASVHRGAFFASMKTTTGRKLLPESWGFMCPVHTPDGAPCGLLNHLVISASPVGSSIIRSYDDHVLKLARLLTTWGMNPCNAEASESSLSIWLDGRLLGHASPSTAMEVARRLRRAKVQALQALMQENFPEYTAVAQIFPTARVLNLVTSMDFDVSPCLEVALIPLGVSKVSPAPGLFLFTGRARLLRPVLHVDSGLVELIGPLEQVFLQIAVRTEELESYHSHVELSPATSMLSLVASLTPFSDFNQSPRNMYQCQMGKQTMGTAMYNYNRRADNKTYRIQTPQAPLVQTKSQEAFGIDEYPSGTNAIVAVISYTGYDMDDAMIVNKSSMERGFGHATVYKTHIYQVESPSEEITNPLVNAIRGLDQDGLPLIGAKLKEGDPIVAFHNRATGSTRIEKHKDAEECTVSAVVVAIPPPVTSKRSRQFPSADAGGVRFASVTTRYNRNPVVGDKFSSRHGQKGVLSVLWPQVDMPFTESGMVPDVIINPHAFPSRMTIGMLVEIMAGKVASMYGEPQDATPFTKQGDEPGATAVDYFGQQLVQAGYSYYGSEPLYSGVVGKELRADIFFGPCYYQRLRHMVSDKSQVRSTGPVDALTRQPIKGRKRHGGIRFGEMERDSLIAHGAAFLVQDRLLNCSDKHTAYVCCGSLLSVHAVPRSMEEVSTGLQALQGYRPAVKYSCRICGKSDQWKLVTIPYVFRYLVNELASMGIKVEFAFDTA